MYAVQAVRRALGVEPDATDTALVSHVRAQAGLTRPTERPDLWLKPIRRLEREAATPMGEQPGDQGLFAFAILDEAKHEDREAWTLELARDGVPTDECFAWLSRFVRERIANPAAEAGIVRFEASDPF